MRIIIRCLGIIVLTLLHSMSYATQLVNGPGTSSEPLFTFSHIVTSKVYDRGSGTLYCGLGAQDGGKSSLWRAQRPIGNEWPYFAAVDTVDNGINENLLTLVTYTGNKFPYISYVTNDDSTKIWATNFDGTAVPKQSLTLKDASGTDLAAGNSVGSLAGALKAEVALKTTGTASTLNRGFIFAAVPVSGGVWGDNNSGIAVVCMKDVLNIADNIHSIALYQAAAEEAEPTIVKAKKLDVTTPEIGVDGNQPEVILDPATMWWDNYFQRLYIGLKLRLGAAPGPFGAKSVVVGRVDGCGVLTLENIVDNTAVSPAPANDQIIVTQAFGTDAFVYDVRVMHCSTGPSYLIANGTISLNGFPVENRIYALPLVDTPQIPAQHGTLANKNSALRDYKFIDPATIPNDLPKVDQEPAIVGAGPLPIQPLTGISDIEVIGDTVFVSTCTGNAQTDNNGIFYSQALFDTTGKIVRWTPWTKKAWPFNTFCNTSCLNTGVRFFAVDAVTGKVWAIDCATQRVVQVTAWDKGAPCPTPTLNCGPATPPCCTRGCGGCCSCSRPCNPVYAQSPVCNNLTAKVNSALFDGSYSVLDLDQGTNGFTFDGINPGFTTPNRFAFFGGMGKVAFARTSSALGVFLESPQDVIVDFENAQNFLETKLTTTNKNQMKCVKVLEYSRPFYTFPSLAYFFAGTDQGLFVYAKRVDMSGYNVNELALPLLASTGQWFDIAKDLSISELNESIIDIKSSGVAVYILTRSVVDGTMVSTLYGYPLAINLMAMFDPADQHVLAQSSVAEFSQAPAFTAIQLVNNNVGLELATNNGLFVSTAANINAATNQADAAWIHVPQFDRTMFEGIAAPDSAHPSTTWPISVEDQCGWHTYEQSSIHQMSIAPNPLLPFLSPTFIPNPFNAISQSTNFATLDPVTYFWSDGARRFFIINRPQEAQTINRLMTFPYNTVEWNVCSPQAQVLLFDPYVVATNRFFWVKQIGYTGILMAGTDTGVIALE